MDRLRVDAKRLREMAGVPRSKTVARALLCGVGNSADSARISIRFLYGKPQKDIAMNANNICHQWFEFNRAALEPVVSWNEIMFQSLEKLVGSRQIFDQFFEINRVALNPLMRGNEFIFRATEKIIQHNLGLAQDYLDMGIRQRNLWCDVKNIPKWKNEERKLLGEFSERLVDRGEAYLKLANELSNTLGGLVEDAAEHMVEATQQATKTTARLTSEVAGKTAESTHARGQATPGEAAKPHEGATAKSHDGATAKSHA
ncbi:hypothetical protein [Methylomagnum ishizawai]|uniref:hypothetical protein n=1 Tax=Methylomagnum ishizawai TaxID=1760988 RepID=UPI001C7F62C6|nr:hypothetical protein [Methylomagnum ishizawai]